MHEIHSLVIAGKQKKYWEVFKKIKISIKAERKCPAWNKDLKYEIRTMKMH